MEWQTAFRKILLQRYDRVNFYPRIRMLCKHIIQLPKLQTSSLRSVSRVFAELMQDSFKFKEKHQKDEMNPRCSYTPEIDALRHEQRASVLASVQESSLPLDSSYLRAWFYIYCYGSPLLLIIHSILFQTSEQIFERKFVTKSDCCWLVDTAGFQMPKSPKHLKLLCLLRAY